MLANHVIKSNIYIFLIYFLFFWNKYTRKNRCSINVFFKCRYKHNKDTMRLNHVCTRVCICYCVSDISRIFLYIYCISKYNTSAMGINDFFIVVGEQYRALHSINRRTITFNEVQWNSQRVSNTSLFRWGDTAKIFLFKSVFRVGWRLLYKYSQNLRNINREK